MKSINTITSDYKQKFKFLTSDGEQVNFRLYYYITQQSWFFDFSYKNYTCNCQKVVLTPNALNNNVRTSKELPISLLLNDNNDIGKFSTRVCTAPMESNIFFALFITLPAMLTF